MKLKGISKLARIELEELEIRKLMETIRLLNCWDRPEYWEELGVLLPHRNKVKMSQVVAANHWSKFKQSEKTNIKPFPEKIRILMNVRVTVIPIFTGTFEGPQTYENKSRREGRRIETLPTTVLWKSARILAFKIR